MNDLVKHLGFRDYGVWTFFIMLRKIDWKTEWEYSNEAGLNNEYTKSK